MRLPLRITRGVATLAAIAALAAFDTARANHFILPCGDICTNAQWNATGSLHVARTNHTATLLQDGSVLVAGGDGGGDGLRILDSAELYDPATGTWSETGHLGVPRTGHTAALLPDGRVLVAGGGTNHLPVLPDSGTTETAEIYDPATGTWSATGSMSATRFGHAATLLHDGKVLVAGGYSTDTVRSAELYDPGTGAWSMTGGLNEARYWHTMTLLDNGEVLVVGGTDDGDLWRTLPSAELYDPLAGSWGMVGDSGPSGSVMHTATLLPDGTVLVTGGYGRGSQGPVVLAEARLFDPVTRAWSSTADLVTPLYGHTATLLANGEVLVAGGYYYRDHGGSYPSLRYANAGATETAEPDTATWSVTAELNDLRLSHTATLLADGRVLVAGGKAVGPDFSTIPLASAELYGAAIQPLGLEPRPEPLPIVPGRGRILDIGAIR